MKRVTRRNPAARSQFSPDIPSLLQRIYANRGLQSDHDVDLALKNLLPASELKGLEPALDLLVSVLEKRQRILVVGDFDADGATSSALSVLALRKLGAAAVDYLVPNRFEYGYGLTPEIVAVALQRSPDLILTVDNGISSIEGVKAAKAAGIKVLVTDHHLPAQVLPIADAIINPNQPGCAFPSKNLAGVGVAFYLMTALRTRLKQIGWFQRQGLAEPNMADYLDIVALGTVADVVPLDHNNRILVHHGLARMRAGRCRPGIQALVSVAKRRLSNLVATDLGFAVGPRLNAAGRLTDMSKGIECLLVDDPAVANRYAAELDQLNHERKSIEGDMQQQALAALKQLQLGKQSELPWGLCIYKRDWHQGVIGILASRIKERFHRPTIAFAPADGGEIKGSARSIPGFHIRDALDAVASRHPGLIVKFGGHAMAAGLSIREQDLEAFQAAFDAQAHRLLQLDDLTGELHSDGELSEADIDLSVAQMLRQAGPWGQGFPEPLFDGRFELLDQRIVGEKHLKLSIGLPASKRVVDAIAFNVDLDKWPNRKLKQIYLAYRLDVNEFRGVQNAQLMVEHLEPA
ncbi:MAG: single-stranded-DNA-specific exonuclease RecJ [Alcanivorax sp.]|uniref:single-stranded-DNA-specific exonuclease RecJ n=1 Tax=unclassified Ketobacter TaxID=2639109 RepID=UPI000C91D669|nr:MULTISPECIES: single-stranded-DNA-specific exonuclease RecJ [unclassified Ketobacter]MAA59482.1 single-stranded-DNA-specific exonuclease RecJ [Pseudomonadales bacterium]MEC8813615.1 single-stranded-DNA-specific exonuclease RecJ [Pseudomonadota bacterium]TNC89138.1 MAG: single-stranded-DNA-specific exonuclease RecJ [Alcanivorax sp.]HAU13203.1 single-stranded-DNA-specific exonuclease RecJ [Gammaproteobacteria bacterium]RLT88434.1 MAG: single-stranded-DNA-specific exonuclease RecJ [Ketobacter 